MKTLERFIPARTEKLKIQFVNRGWMTYGNSKTSRKALDKPAPSGCGWCRRAMTDDDMLSLAVPVEKKPVLEICDNCADSLEPG